jgi:hypothetical protein
MALPWAASCLPLRGGEAPFITDSWRQPVNPSTRGITYGNVLDYRHCSAHGLTSGFPSKNRKMEAPSNPAPRRGIPSQPMATPWDIPMKKIRPARAHQNGPGPSQWGRRYEGAPGGLNANTGAFPRRCQGLRVGCPCGAKKAPGMGHIWYEPFRFPYDSRRREGAPRNLPAAAALLVHPTRTPARTGNPGAWPKGLASIPRESSASPRGAEGPQVPTGAGCGGGTGGCEANSNAPPHTET